MEFPDLLNVRDKDNRLPIHVALDAGIEEWSRDFESQSATLPRSRSCDITSIIDIGSERATL